MSPQDINEIATVLGERHRTPRPLMGAWRAISVIMQLCEKRAFRLMRALFGGVGRRRAI